MDHHADLVAHARRLPRLSSSLMPLTVPQSPQLATPPPLPNNRLPDCTTHPAQAQRPSRGPLAPLINSMALHTEMPHRVTPVLFKPLAPSASTADHTSDIDLWSRSVSPIGRLGEVGEAL
jgi:hypothetical protein